MQNKRTKLQSYSIVLKKITLKQALLHVLTASLQFPSSPSMTHHPAGLAAQRDERCRGSNNTERLDLQVVEGCL